MNEDVGIAVSSRRLAGYLTLLIAMFALLAWVPGAVALDPPVDAAVIDTGAVIDTTTTAIDTTAAVTPGAADPVTPVTPVAADPITPVTPVAADPVTPVTPVAADPTVITPTPDPAAGVAPTPVDAAAPTTPDVIVAVHDASPVTGGEVNALTVTGADPVAAPRLDPVNAAPATSAADVGPTSQAAPTPPVIPSSVITALVVPIVQTLGPGLLLPYVRPETFGPQTPAPHTAGDLPTAPAQAPAHPAQASPVTPAYFGVAVPHGGWSGQSAGIFVLLLSLLPLGLPDGKFSIGGPTQLAVLLMGALLMLIPFFASSIRDDRRRGPRGFAALALRPG